MLEQAGARLTVAALGGMVEARLRLPDGRLLEPLFRPHWANSPAAPAEPTLLGALRGEWLCVPFGYPREAATLTPAWRIAGEEPDDWPHGYSANHPWHVFAQDPGSLALAIDYPLGHAVSRLERRFTLAPGGEGFTVRSVVEVRRACALPVALHACLALPARAGAAHLRPGRFRRGYTHPSAIEPGRSRAAVDARFADLAAVPAAAGGTRAFNRLPLADAAEDVLFLAGCEGRFEVVDEVAGARTVLTWDAGRLPHCQVWVSNRGRRAPPWDGRNVCVGIEPCCAAMDLGSAVSAGPNPVRSDGFATEVAFSPAAPWECSYALRVEPA